MSWLTLYAMIGLTWLGLLLLVLGGNLLSPGFASDARFWYKILFTHPHKVEFHYLLSMWSLMSVAMMLPSFVPTLRVYNDLQGTGAGSKVGFWCLILGYVAVWLAYSLGMTYLQLLLDRMDILSVHGLGANLLPLTIMLTLAGVYQFTSFKDNCLTYCRSPFVVFLARGNVSLWEEFQTGFGFGLWCLGCCFMLMMLCIVSGLMNIVWMSLMAVVITIEKLPDLGKYVSKPLGVLLLVSALITAFHHFD